MSDFPQDWHANVARLVHTYSPEQEHDSCGVGLIASLDGKTQTRRGPGRDRCAARAVAPRRRGCGRQDRVMAPASISKFRRTSSPKPSSAAANARRTGRSRWAMVFLPKTDFSAQERCRQIVETEILNFGYQIYGWRQVPIDVSVIGEKGQRDAAGNRADHGAQRAAAATPAMCFERDLYVIRRRIEKSAIAAHRYRSSISARCPAGRSSTRACSWRSIWPRSTPI